MTAKKSIKTRKPKPLDVTPLVGTDWIGRLADCDCPDAMTHYRLNSPIFKIVFFFRRLANLLKRRAPIHK